MASLRKNPRPPQSEQHGRGALINPHNAEYQRIGNSRRFRTPDRMMTVGVRNRRPLSASEFGGGEFNLQKAARNKLSRRR